MGACPTLAQRTARFSTVGADDPRSTRAIGRLLGELADMATPRSQASRDLERSIRLRFACARADEQLMGLCAVRFTNVARLESGSR